MKRSKAGDEFSKVVVQVLYLNGLLLEKGNEIAAVKGQTSARWRVLAALEDAPRTVATVAKLLHLTRQSVQRVADALAQDRLIVFRKNPADARADLADLTSSGKATLRAVQERQIEWANTLGANVGEEKLRRLREDLNALLEALR